MRLTVKRTLEECRKMWQWLADNPGKDKYDYFTLNNIADRVAVACFACEAVKRRTGYKPSIIGIPSLCLPLCVLRDLWPAGCEAYDSPYNTWRLATESSARRAAALQIVAGCDAALAKLAKRKPMICKKKCVNTNK